MKEIGRIPLPSHRVDGEFDHAAVDSVGDRLFVAHPSNNTVEVVDLAGRRHLCSLPHLVGVAGVWVNSSRRLLFTSNRGEDTASIFRLGDAEIAEESRVRTGVRPNGMAFDPGRDVLMVAGVGNSQTPDSPPSLTFVDVRAGTVIAHVKVPGRTRWALYHSPSDSFYVNIADPPTVIAVRGGEVPSTTRSFPIPAHGPHGLEQDPDGTLLYCACDDGALVSLDLDSRTATQVGTLSGPPDVVWVNPKLDRLYCAVGQPGLIDVFDLRTARLSETVTTGEGAHTLTLDSQRDEVHVFLPAGHEDLVLTDKTD